MNQSISEDQKEGRISKEELMVFIKGFLDSILDDQTSKQQEDSIELFNQFFRYVLKYNRTGIADKIMRIQKTFNQIPERECPSCGVKGYFPNAECDDCRKQI